MERPSSNKNLKSLNSTLFLGVVIELIFWYNEKLKHFYINNTKTFRSESWQIVFSYYDSQCYYAVTQEEKDIRNMNLYAFLEKKIKLFSHLLYTNSLNLGLEIIFLPFSFFSLASLVSLTEKSLTWAW